MKINKFPRTMWDKVGTEANPPIRRAWRANVTCGSLADLKLGGCGAEITLSRKDYYKKPEFVMGSMGNSFWWRCPCCGTSNPLDTSLLELNNNVLNQKEYLEKLRESMAAELLKDSEFRQGINYEPADQFLRKLGIEVPDELVTQMTSFRVTKPIDE